MKELCFLLAAIGCLWSFAGALNDTSNTYPLPLAMASMGLAIVTGFLL